MATKKYSGITNWGDAAAEVKIEVELSDGEVSAATATITGVMEGNIRFVGEAELEPPELI